MTDARIISDNDIHDFYNTSTIWCKWTQKKNVPINQEEIELHKEGGGGGVKQHKINNKILKVLKKNQVHFNT